MKKLYNFIFLLCTAFLFAQVPSNDTCGNALAVALPGSGSVCFNSSNLNATSDNSTNACDTGAAGNEVWYTFIASNANNTITITPNGATPITDAVVTLITSGCAAGTYDVCNAATGSNPAITTLGLTPGTQVWFSVESNGTDGTFQVCIDSTPPAASPGNTCASATNICDKSNISVPDLTGFTASGVQPACFGAAVRKDVWVQFTVGVTGTLEFMGTPIAADEYDWALYNVTSGCLGTLVSCNYNYATGGPMSCGTPGAPFGMLAVTTGQLCPAEFNAPITVTAGQTYALLIDNFSQTNNGFDLQWGGTFQMGTAAIFTVDPQSSCSVPLTVNITNNSVGATTYLWNFGDGTTSTSPNPGTHTYTATGDYLISLTVTGNGCTSVISQRVNLNAGPVISVTPPSATICPGENVLLNANLSLGTPYNDRQFSSAVNTAIPNNTAAGLVVNQSSTGMINTTLTPGSVQSICFTVNHTNHSDIGRDTPTAVQITVNGNTYNFTPLPLPAVSGTRTYCFPQTVLDAIAAAGGPSNTTWTLKVADNRGGGGGTGSLVSWQVTLRDFNSILGYSWSPTTDMINSTTLSPTVSPSVNTTYILSVTDLFGCTTQFSVPIVIGGGPATPTITTTAPTCLADGSSTITNYDGTLTYVFTPAGPTVGAGGVISGMVLGTSYTVTAGNGACTSVASASFTNLAQLTVPVVPTVSVTAPTCSADGFATITNYVGGLTYVFTPAGPTVDGSGLISNMTIGTNYVVSASNGSCASADSASFAIAAMLITPAVPTITTTAPTCLADGFSQISNYVGGTIYTFTPAGPTVDGTGMISGMVLGTSYTVTAGNGTCTSVASASFTNLAQLTVPVVPTVSVTAPTCSADGFATITNYVGGLTYVFTPAGPTVDGSGLISNMTIGTNYVVSASNGSCASADSSSFAIAAMLITPAVPTITTTTPTCLADGFSEISNYVGGTIYVFTPSGPSVDGTGMISGMTIGTSYTVTAGNGTCTSVASAAFTNLAQLTVPVVPTVSVTAPTCSADGFATITNYVGGLTYVFTPAGPTVDGTGLISNMTVGTSYVVSASNGSCASANSSSFVIAAMLVTPAVPTIDTTAPTCLADGFSEISNYVGGTIYVFTPSGPSVDGTGMISGMTIGTSYTVTAGNGTCTSVASAAFTNLVQLTVPVVPTVSVTAPTCSADGFATITNYVGGLTYVFTPAGPTVDGTGLISNMTVGTSYVVSASNGSCASADSASFAIAAILPTPSIATVAVTQPSCAVPTATILVLSPVGANLEYSINNGVSYQTSTSFSGLAPSLSYTIIVRDVVSGCISSPSSNIIVDAVPASPIVTLSSGCNGSSYEIVASTTSSSATYQWYSGSTLIASTSTVVISNTGTYQVDVTVDGCTTTEFVTIDNVTCSIPKGISPNGDGLNDNWDITGLNARKVQIFNRYGVEVYSRPNYTNEFEGKTNNGNELPTATYYYVITLGNGNKTGWLYINRAQ
jgi:gliding motility-associated-like protein